MRLAEVALGVAIGDLARNVREQGGDNRGPEVGEYLANAGIPVPAAWCAAFVQWISDKAAQINGASNPLDAVAREALVADYVTLAEQRGWIVDGYQVRRGDLMCFRFGNSGRWNHIGIVMDPPIRTPAGWGRVRTVEGNTNQQGVREGDGVFQKMRAVVDGRVCFIQWDTPEDVS